MRIVHHFNEAEVAPAPVLLGFSSFFRNQKKRKLKASNGMRNSQLSLVRERVILYLNKINVIVLVNLSYLLGFDGF